MEEAEDRLYLEITFFYLIKGFYLKCGLHSVVVFKTR